MKKLIFLIILPTIFFILIQTGCTKKSNKEKVITRYTRTFSTLDVQKDTILETGFFALHIFDRLLELDKNGNIYPSLLKKMPKLSDDKLSFEFELKRGIKFTDGEELTSSDVEFSFARMLLPEISSPSTWILENVEGANKVMDGSSRKLSGFKILDKYRFKITLKQADRLFLMGLTAPYASIYPEKGCTDQSHNWDKKAYGTGPFTIIQWNNKEIVLKKNIKYHGKLPKIDKIVNKLIYDPAELQAEYDLGKSDIINIPSDKLKEYNNNKKYKNELKVEKTLLTRYLTLNNQYPILQKPEVREAISLAIDRKNLCEKVLSGAAVPAYTIIPEGLDGYDKNAKITFDPLKAKELLGKAGYINGFSIDYIQPNEDLLVIDIAIQSMLEKVGIKLNIVKKFGDSFQNLKASNNFTLCLSRWCADIPDADNYLALFTSTHSSRYNNKSFDNLVNEARVLQDREKRKTIYEKLDKMLCREDWGTIPISHDLTISLVKPYIKGFYIDKIRNIPIFWDAYRVD